MGRSLLLAYVLMCKRQIVKIVFTMWLLLSLHYLVQGGILRPEDGGLCLHRVWLGAVLRLPLCAPSHHPWGHHQA